MGSFSARRVSAWSLNTLNILLLASVVPRKTSKSTELTRTMAFLSMFQGSLPDERPLKFIKHANWNIRARVLMCSICTYHWTLWLGALWLSSRTPNPSVVIRQPIGWTVCNSWANLTHHDIAASHNAHRHSSSPPIEWHRRMKGSNRVRRKNICLVASNLHRHCRRAGKQRREEDFVLNDNIRTRGWLPRSIPCGSVAGTRGGGREAIPEVEPLFRNSRLTGLVG